MSFLLFDFEHLPDSRIEREKTPDEMMRERKLNELTNALFEVWLREKRVHNWINNVQPLLFFTFQLLYWLTMCVMLFFLIQHEGCGKEADLPDSNVSELL